MDIENPEFRTAKDLKDRYEAIYSETFDTSFVGIHSTILHYLKSDLAGKSVLDIGCGAGRLSIACALFAKEVDGFDWSEKAIATAQSFAKLANIPNVNFFVGEEKTFKPSKSYDIVLLPEVLEHVDDPAATLKRINSFLKPGGILVISCPGFNNFRGYSYLTLFHLLGLPMSLTDVRQVYPEDMRKWSSDTGFQLERMVGNCYDWGWLEKSCTDMARRVPLAARDAKLTHPTDFEKYNSWFAGRKGFHENLISFLVEKGFLQKRQKEYDLDLPEDIDPKAREYLLDGDTERNAHFSDTEVIAELGGDIIYFLRKLG